MTYCDACPTSSGTIRVCACAKTASVGIMWMTDCVQVNTGKPMQYTNMWHKYSYQQIEMGRQGKRLSSTAKSIVNNVSEFMVIEKRAGRSILRLNVVQRVARHVSWVRIRFFVSGVKQKPMGVSLQFGTPTERYSGSRKQMNVTAYVKTHHMIPTRNSKYRRKQWTGWNSMKF